MGKQVAHIPFEHQLFSNQAEYRKRCREDKPILHLGSVVRECLEKVVMLHRPKRTLDHGVLKIGRSVVSGDLASEMLLHPQVGGSPPYELSQSNQSSGDATNGLFASLFGSK
jgi:hypothetical protein